MWSCSQSLGMQHSCIVCRTAKIVFKVRPGNKDVDLTQSLSIWVGVSDPTKYKYVHIMLKRRVWVLVCKINTRVINTGLIPGSPHLEQSYIYWPAAWSCKTTKWMVLLHNINDVITFSWCNVTTNCTVSANTLFSFSVYIMGVWSYHPQSLRVYTGKTTGLVCNWLRILGVEYQQTVPYVIHSLSSPCNLIWFLKDPRHAYIPYTGKLSREKTFARIGEKYDFRGENLSRIAYFCCAKGRHAPKFRREHRMSILNLSRTGRTATATSYASG